MSSRRSFLKKTTIAGLGMSLAGMPMTWGKNGSSLADRKIGIIGLDTSHADAFTKEFNVNKPGSLAGYRVTAAYPKGSLDIPASTSRIPQFTESVKKMGVEIAPDIETLLQKVDFVLLETNDGRRHVEQALPVFKSRKPIFIDKPIAASLIDAITLFKLSDYYKTPMFSASSLRYMPHVVEVVNGKIGKVLGADAYSPATLEPSHPDFYWYGIHGVETLYTVMGTGCREVVRASTSGTDVVVGTWNDGRIGTFRGTRTGQHTYGGTAYGEKADAALGPYGGYIALLEEIVKFFNTGTVPFDREETLEICTFIEAADESKLTGGGKVNLSEIRNRAERKAEEKFAKIIGG